jgi:hypothetical protein
MTIPASEPDSHARVRASGNVAWAGADGGARSAADGVGPTVRRREDPRMVGEAEAACSPGAAPLSGASARRLRTAPPVQLELVLAGAGPGPDVVWASLPERSREHVLVLLAPLIDSGAVEEESAA